MVERRSSRLCKRMFSLSRPLVNSGKMMVRVPLEASQSSFSQEEPIIHPSARRNAVDDKTKEMGFREPYHAKRLGVCSIRSERP